MLIAVSGLSILEGTILRMSLDHVSKRTKRTFELSLLFKAYDLGWYYPAIVALIETLLQFYLLHVMYVCQDQECSS